MLGLKSNHVSKRGHWRASYGVFIVRILEEVDSVITASHCSMKIIVDHLYAWLQFAMPHESKINWICDSNIPRSNTNHTQLSFMHVFELFSISLKSILIMIHILGSTVRDTGYGTPHYRIRGVKNNNGQCKWITWRRLCPPCTYFDLKAPK